MKPEASVHVDDEDLALRLGGLFAVLEDLLPVQFALQSFFMESLACIP